MIADFTTVTFEHKGSDCVGVKGGGGKPMPGTLKVSVGYKAGFIGEGEISYASSCALERAQLAGAIIKKRIGHRFKDLRIDYIGCTSVHPTSLGKDRLLCVLQVKRQHGMKL